jgi:3-dehydroquinate dehydratase-2
MLGKREPTLYGNQDFKALISFIKRAVKNESGKSRKWRAVFFQSNYEGKIIDKIQSARGKFDYVIINAGAFTHTSLAILDALKSAAVPAVEVHLTDIEKREDYRKFSYVSEYAEKTICGKGFEGYAEAVRYIAEKNPR